MVRLALTGLALVVAAGWACVPAPIPVTPCTAIYVYGLNVTVTSATTGAPITDATVTITEGAYQETLVGDGSGGYIGAGERAGSYILNVSAPGYQPAPSQVVDITADECHVIPVTRTVALNPA